MEPSRAVRTALSAWILLTIAIVSSIVFIQLRWGQKGFDLFIQQWPLTTLRITLGSVAMTWSLVGLLLYFLQAKRVNSSNIFAVSGFFIACWAYLNSLNEHYRYGDYTYYQEAAVGLIRNKHFPDTYFYPPFWATVLRPIALLEPSTFLLILWLVNFLSFMTFFVLLYSVLKKYGFSSQLAGLIATFFVLINAPLLRTLDYVQVNIHVLNFVFASLLLFEKRPFLSALMLAFAIHLKASPILLALAFLPEKDWRWLAWLGLNILLIGSVTVFTNGFTPFLDFLQNSQILAASINTTFHDTSFDSFLRFIGPFLHIEDQAVHILIYAAKVLLMAATLWIVVLSVKNQTFYESKERGARLLNAIPPLFILMTLASPIVWEHHGIFVALPFLLMFKKLQLPSDWLWFGFAYFLEFILPTFDFFPWSYGRLVAPLIVLWLMWAVSKRVTGTGLIMSLNIWIDALPPLTVRGK